MRFEFDMINKTEDFHLDYAIERVTFPILNYLNLERQ